MESKYMSIGDTREVNGIRIHMYTGVLEITDIRDAGRRGKLCGRATLAQYADGSDLMNLAYRITNATDFDAARGEMRFTATQLGLRMNERTLRAVDVLPAADAPLVAVFRYNGIQVGGALIKGWFSHSAAWSDGTRSVPEHITFYSKSYHSELLRRVFAGQVRNGTDTMTDYFEEDHIRLNVDHPRYAEALAAANARQARWDAKKKA